ncbi:leucyl aminopeptidase [Pollutimonas harenae]|uniref:Probable cytosol aminopeptidase n=1 Tax=Pollutimonas harenae TaxID=657015 RepID=A0A853H1A7_9BURK|nr:leucyl aminopeptidase [Pollutimonas harenae]NYT85549.1 leucyl aminopeptidase [Pollutimonas harenae]TEA70634.1 leucyl aminopeptidase [Pollutimonas harenae]
MEFSTQTTASLHQIKTAALAVGVFSDGLLSPAADVIDHASNGALRAIIKTEFKAKPHTHLVLRDLTGVSAARVILVGLGKQDSYNAAAHAGAELVFANYCANAGLTEGVSALAAIECPNVKLRTRAKATAIAASRALYRYDATFGEKREAAPKLKKIAVWVARNQATEAQHGLREGRAIGNGMNLTRLLGDLPPNVCTPTYLGSTAKALAKEFKNLKAEVLGVKQIEALKMGSFLSVARGSYEPPAFIVLKHSAAGKGSSKKAKAPIVLVGKGITFDAGGISLKPASNMDEMKYDMCGAASVLGTMRAVAELELDRDVIGIVPSCENLPSGRANKPGDIVISMSGQTIEILNTDAEGRLVLCDALTYAERFKPAAVIDIATLTGACVVALGHVNTGLFSTNDELAEGLLQAGREANDTAWRMPMDDAYQEQLRSNFADVANIGGPPAGAVTAACFLSRFTKNYPWAHLDIAGTAWRSGKDKGASGRPVPLLVQYLLNQA